MKPLLRWLCVFCFSSLASALSAGELTPATGGESIPARTAGQSYTELDGPVYDEGAQGEVDADLVLRLPAGFEWDTNASPRARVTLLNPPRQGGRNINNKANGEFIEGNEIAFNGPDLIVSITQKTTGNRRNRLEFENLRVRPVNEDPGASGDILEVGNAGLGGLAEDASWGFLRQEAFADDILMFVDGKTPGPVNVVRGEAVDFSVEATGCEAVSASEWRYTWKSGDGEELQEARMPSPCDASPIPYSHVYERIGNYESSFTAEYCPQAQQGCPPNDWQFFGEARVEVVVGLESARAIYNFLFDEPDWDGTDGEVRDFSGNNLSGTALGAVTSRDTPAIAGEEGTCGYGAFAGSDLVTAPGTDRVNLADSFSLSTWVRLPGSDQTDAQPVLMAYGDPADGFAGRLQLSLEDTGSDTAYVFGLRTSGGDIVTLRTSAGPDPLSGDWLHVAASYDSVRAEAVLYINGEQTAVQTLQNPRGNQDPELPADAAGGLSLMAYGDGSRGAVGTMDEPRLFDGILSAGDVQSLFEETRRCPVFDALASLTLDVPATASVCVPAPVVITARDSNGNVITRYSGTVDLSTSAGRGNWSLAPDAEGVLDPANHSSNDGAARYSFSEADDGRAELRLANESADELRITARDSEAGVTGTSPAVQFLENAFVVSLVDDLGTDLVAGRPHALEVAAVRRDQNGECGLVSAYDGEVTLKAWRERDNADPGGEAPALAGQTLPESRPASGNVTLAFDQGRASPALGSSDVGRFTLRLRDDESGRVVDAEGNPIPVEGASAPLTLRPFAFRLGVAGNPAAEGPEGNAFVAAGSAFDASLEAVAWQAEDDTNNDGQPDGHDTTAMDDRADLSDNPVTGAFSLAEEAVSLSSDLVSGPSQAADPPLQLPQPVSAFSNGRASAAARYLEVGSIALLGQYQGDYLGRPVTLRGRSGFVGRFHPAEFTASVMDGAFAPFCGDFVYTGQDFSYDLAPELTITPRGAEDNGTGPLLSNYREQWQRLTAADVLREFPLADDNNGLAVESGEDIGALVALGDGRMDYVFAGSDRFRYLKNMDARIDPFASALSIAVTAVEDGDASLAPSQSPGGDSPLVLTPAAVEMRYGRLRLENTFGPAGIELEMPFRATYFQGGDFVRNLAESGASEGAGECFIYNPVQDTALSPGTVGEVTSSDGDFQLLSGEPEEAGTLRLRSLEDEIAPGDPNQETLTFTVPLWLQGDYNGDGTLTNPAATATFGVYRGHDRIIYWREVNP